MKRIKVKAPKAAVMVPIVDILRDVTSSCDFGDVDEYPGSDMDEKRTNFWHDVIKVKAGDSGFGHLIDSILEAGFTNSAIGWADGSYISEGHHRLVAAILLGMDEVPVTNWGMGGSHLPRKGMPNYFSAHSSDLDTSIQL